MKIASVDGYVLNFPQDPPWGYSKGWVTSAPTLLIERSTNDGISGWGEAYGPPKPIFEMIKTLTDDEAAEVIASVTPEGRAGDRLNKYPKLRALLFVALFSFVTMACCANCIYRRRRLHTPLP